MVKVKATKAAKTNKKTGRTSGKTTSATVTSARKPTASKFFSVSNLIISACQECNAIIEDDTKALQCENVKKLCMDMPILSWLISRMVQFTQILQYECLAALVLSRV